MTVNVATESGRWKPPNSHLCTSLSEIKGWVNNERAHFQVEGTGGLWQTVSKPGQGELLRMTVILNTRARLAVLFSWGLDFQPLLFSLDSLSEKGPVYSQCSRMCFVPRVM